MKILVTGATGMVGRNILEHPQLSKFNLYGPRRSEMDLFSYAGTLDYIRRTAPDLIIHCAGKVGGIQANIDQPVSFLTENIDINRNLILAAREAGVKKVINLGSSCMYPRNVDHALTEDMILKGELEPTNEGYALAKIMAQRLCSYISREDPRFQYKTIIPCNLYGRHDNFNERYAHLIPAVIMKLHHAKVHGLSEVEIWGDGTARREFMYAADLSDCLYHAVENFEVMPDVMNAGLGHDYSINEYYAAAAEVIGYMGKFRHDLSRPVGMRRKLTSVAKASDWGWGSRTSLVEGLRQTYKYFQENNLGET